MPPPKHVHPGRLVVTKPDLPEQPHIACAGAGPPPGCGHRTLSGGLDTDRCRCYSQLAKHSQHRRVNHLCS